MGLRGGVGRSECRSEALLRVSEYSEALEDFEVVEAAAGDFLRYLARISSPASASGMK